MEQGTAMISHLLADQTSKYSKSRDVIFSHSKEPGCPCINNGGFACICGQHVFNNIENDVSGVPNAGHNLSFTENNYTLNNVINGMDPAQNLSA